MKSGALLVKVEKPKHAENLVKINRFHLTPAKCTPRGSLNKSRGIISCPDLARVSEDETVSEVSSQNVSEARRISIWRDGVKKVQIHLSLLFEQPFYQKH